MSDAEILRHFGLDETMQMLEFREKAKSQMSPEEWEQNMTTHKATIKKMMDDVPTLRPIEAADYIVYMLDRDQKLASNVREVWKALVVIAAFEMQEM